MRVFLQRFEILARSAAAACNGAAGFRYVRAIRRVCSLSEPRFRRKVRYAYDDGPESPFPAPKMAAASVSSESVAWPTAEVLAAVGRDAMQQGVVFGTVAYVVMQPLLRRVFTAKSGAEPEVRG